MITKSFLPKLCFYLTAVILTVSISTGAYSSENSALEIVPMGTSICLKLTDLRGLEWKLTDLVRSLDIPDAPNANIGALLGQMTGTNIKSLMDLEDAGFNMKGDFLIFWVGLSFDKFSIAVHVNSRQDAEMAARSQIGGVDKEYKGITYAQSETSATWVFLDDVFVYSKDKAVIMNVIETHLKEKPSILKDKKFTAGVKDVRAGNLNGYVALDEIASAFLPMLQMQAEKAKENISKQMSQQKNAMPPGMDLDPAKILAAEIDAGLWLLQQLRSYSISMDIGNDGIWMSDSLKFKPDSPICGFLNIRPRKLELVRYLPGDILIAGGATMNAPSFEKFNSVMFDLMMPVLREKMAEAKLAELRAAYDRSVNEIFSCLGDELAFAVSTKSDRMMPRLVYILDVADEAKARETIGNLDYIQDMSKPFYEAFGMDLPIMEGPTQRYNGIQIKSFQMDLSKMKSLAADARTMYPESIFLWYAFVDGKMIYAMSQSADTIKDTVDAMKGRKIGISSSPTFEDLNIRLPEKSNATVYISPTGYLQFIMGMMMRQMKQGMPVSSIKPDIGFAVTTNLTGDGVSNFAYFLTQQIQELIGMGMNFGQMMNRSRR